jgi:hypothetical protein
VFKSDYDEIPAEQASEISAAPPLLGAERTLVRAYRGRFCFDFGLATSCLKTTISLTEGETHSLGLSVGGKWGQVSHDMTYTMERTITYEVDECDSAAPVLKFDDSELQVYELNRFFLGIRWAQTETRFIPGGRPVLCGNKVNDDPACGCASDRPPSGSTDDQQTLHREAEISRILQTATFVPAPQGSPVPDPEEAASYASQLLAESIGDVDRTGIRGLDGSVIWLDRDTDLTALSPALLSSDCNAALRGRLLVPEKDPHFPLLALMAASPAESGRVTVYLNEGDRLVRFLDQPAYLLADRFLTIWAGIDFSEIPAGASGTLELALRDRHDDPVGRPLRQPFEVMPQPVEADAGALLPA